MVTRLCSKRQPTNVHCCIAFLTPFLAYIAFISVFCLTDGAAATMYNRENITSNCKKKSVIPVVWIFTLLVKFTRSYTSLPSILAESHFYREWFRRTFPNMYISQNWSARLFTNKGWAEIGRLAFLLFGDEPIFGECAPKAFGEGKIDFGRKWISLKLVNDLK